MRFHYVYKFSVDLYSNQSFSNLLSSYEPISVKTEWKKDIRGHFYFPATFFFISAETQVK